MTVYFFNGPIRYMTTVVILRWMLTVTLPSRAIATEPGTSSSLGLVIASAAAEVADATLWEV